MSRKGIIAAERFIDELDKAFDKEFDLDKVKEIIEAFQAANKINGKREKAVIVNPTFSDDFGWLLDEKD